MIIVRGTGKNAERFEIPSGRSYSSLTKDTQNRLHRTVCSLLSINPKMEKVHTA